MLKWIAVVLLVLLFALQLKLWIGDGGMRDLRAIDRHVADLTAENTRLKQRNEALRADVADLKQGGDAVEARARVQLGLLKPGEVFYQIVDVPTAASSALPARAGSGAGR